MNWEKFLCSGSGKILKSESWLLVLEALGSQDTLMKQIEEEITQNVSTYPKYWEKFIPPGKYAGGREVWRDSILVGDLEPFNYTLSDLFIDKLYLRCLPS